MKRFQALGVLVLLQGCAMPTSVQRIGVGYNNAVANLTDELALLNIVRAQNDYPLHYTSLSRLSGSITLKVTGGFNAQVKAAAPTDTNSSTTTTAPTGVAVANVVTRAITSGGNQYMPSIGGEVDTNPSFDVNVNDTQDFYRGVTASIDPSMIDNFIKQGYDQRELLALTVKRVDFMLADTSPLLTEAKGATLLSLENDLSDSDTPPPNRNTSNKVQFKNLFGCYTFQTADQKDAPKVLAPLSRISGSNPNAPSRWTFQDLASLDGTKLELSTPITNDASADRLVNVVRPSNKKSVGKFTWNGQSIPSHCDLVARDLVDDHSMTQHVYASALPPADRLFVGNSMLFTAGNKPGPTPPIALVKVDIAMTLRSPEAVIQFVGRCLGQSSATATKTCSVGTVTLFELVPGRGAAADVSAEFGGVRYHVDGASANGKASLRTLGLVEKLIDLNKISSDKPVTQAVHIVS